MELKMPGKVYEACFDPDATGVPGQSGWPEPMSRKAGKGRTYVYEVTLAQKLDMIDHAYEWGTGLLYGVDPDTAAEARAVVRWCARNGRP